MIETLPPQGWECPRCHLVHSPQTPSCSCRPRDDRTLGERIRAGQRSIRLG